jgi:hypothetical protein
MTKQNKKKTATVAGENTSEKVKVAALKTYLPAKERKPRRRQKLTPQGRQDGGESDRSDLEPAGFVAS